MSNHWLDRFQTLSVLKIPAYRNYQIGRLLFLLGLQMQSVLIAIYVYYLTKDPMALGLTGLSEAIPYLVTAFFAGSLADIYNRKKMVIFAACGYLISIVILTIVVLFRAQIGLETSLWLIYAIIFLTGISRGFFAPAQGALLAQIVPQNMYAQSATIGSIVWNTACVAGPALGGILYNVLGVQTTLYLVLGMCSVGVLFMSAITHIHIPVVIKRDESHLNRVFQGVKFVRKTPILYSAMLIDMLAVLFGGAVALIPVFVDKQLHLGEEAIGILRAAPSIGAVVCSFWISYRPLGRHAGKWFLLNIFLFGLCMIGFALSPYLWMSFAFLLLSGAFDNISVIVRSVIYQKYTPDDMRGRVMSINSIFIGSSNEIGSFESGLAARYIGLVPSVLIGAGVTLGVAASATKWAPALWNLHFEE